jgi:hypothetical protein
MGRSNARASFTNFNFVGDLDSFDLDANMQLNNLFDSLSLRIDKDGSPRAYLFFPWLSSVRAVANSITPAHPQPHLLRFKEPSH